MKDIHVDHNTHKLVVDDQAGGADLARTVTELYGEKEMENIGHVELHAGKGSARGETV